MRNYHIAQMNIARIRAPLEDPSMDGFRNQLDPVNAIADARPGFVWRLQSASGNATDIRPYEDPTILVNMSVWESMEALHAFVYAGDHVALLRARRQWFEPFVGPMLVLWWVPAGHIPTVEEGRARLDLLAAKGPTPEAFTFRNPFPPPDDPTAHLPKVDAEFCQPSP